VPALKILAAHVYCLFISLPPHFYVWSVRGKERIGYIQQLFQFDTFASL
jgi:hypothetical protein